MKPSFPYLRPHRALAIPTVVFPPGLLHLSLPTTQLGLLPHPRSHTERHPIYREGAPGAGMTRLPWEAEQPSGLKDIMGTFGDDAPVWKLDVLRAAAGNLGHWWELA